MAQHELDTESCLAAAPRSQGSCEVISSITPRLRKCCSALKMHEMKNSKIRLLGSCSLGITTQLKVTLNSSWSCPILSSAGIIGRCHHAQIAFFFKDVFYFYFAYMGVLLMCLSVYHMCAELQRLEEGTRSLELELQTVISY